MKQHFSSEDLLFIFVRDTYEEKPGNEHRHLFSDVPMCADKRVCAQGAS